jgi:ribosome-associated protein
LHSSSRTQLQNREDAVQKLKDCLAKAAIVPKERNLRVGLADFQKKNRLQEKKKRAKVKSVRRDRNFLDD